MRLLYSSIYYASVGWIIDVDSEHLNRNQIFDGNKIIDTISTDFQNGISNLNTIGDWLYTDLFKSDDIYKIKLN